MKRKQDDVRVQQERRPKIRRLEQTRLQKEDESNRWIEMASDWTLIDKLEHKLLHAMTREQLQEQCQRLQIQPTKSDWEHLEYWSQREQKNVKILRQRFERNLTICRYLRATGQPAYSQWNPFAMQITRLVVRSWTTMDLHCFHEDQRGPSNDWIDGCKCREGQPRRVPTCIENASLGLAPVSMQCTLLENVLNEQKQIQYAAGTRLVLHLSTYHGESYHDKADTVCYTPNPRLYPKALFYFFVPVLSLWPMVQAYMGDDSKDKPSIDDELVDYEDP